MKVPYAVKLGGKMWRVTKLACGYLFRIECGDERLTINFETLVQLEHGK